MKTTSLILVLTTVTAFSQGSLLPPGAPAQTQKSLQEIWDKIGVVEAQNAQLQAQNLLLKSQLTTATLLDAVSPAGLALPWNLRSVDSVGADTSLAFGLDGQPAISYYDNTNQDLKIARFNGSIWSVSTVDSAGAVGLYNSLAFGPDGQPAISYYDNTNQDLKIARFNDSVWSVSSVDSVGNVGSAVSLAFGPDGQPAISYLDNTINRLKIARFNGSVWSVMIVNSDDFASGYNTTLAFGPDGQPAISYYNGGPNDNNIKIARFSSGIWTVAIVKPGVSAGGGGFQSLAFGPDGQPAISYHQLNFDVDPDFPSYEIMIARFNGSAWVHTIVESSENLAYLVSLAFGPDGLPAISYFGNGGLRFARFNGNVWSASTLDSVGSGTPSLAFGPDGQPAISYSGNGGLKIARKGVFPPAP